MRVKAALVVAAILAGTCATDASPGDAPQTLQIGLDGSGGLAARTVDYAFAAPSILKIERVYRSDGATHDGWFGYGWGSRYETYLELRADGSVAAVDYGQPGSATIFEPSDTTPSGTAYDALRDRESIVADITRAADAIEPPRSDHDREAYESQLRALDDGRLETEWQSYYRISAVKARDVTIGTVLYDRAHRQRLVRVPGGYERSPIVEDPKGQAIGAYDGNYESFDTLGMLRRVWDQRHDSVEIRYEQREYGMTHDPSQNRPEELLDNQGHVVALNFSRSSYNVAEHPGITLLQSIALGSRTLASYAFVHKASGRWWGQYLTGVRRSGRVVARYSYADYGEGAELPALQTAGANPAEAASFAYDSTDTSRVISITSGQNASAIHRYLLYLYAANAASPLEAIDSDGETTTDETFDPGGGLAQTTTVRGGLEQVRSGPAALFYQLGGLFAHDGEPRYALAAYRLAAAQGDLRGTQQAAIIEFQGPPEVRDEASSLRDFRRAADLGDGESMLYVVAGLYVAGRGKAADPTLAEQYLAKAAATDDIAGVPDVTMREPSGGEITVATTGDATMVLIEVLERKNAGADSRTRESIVSLFAPPDASTAAGNAPAHGPLTERIESADGVTTDVHFDVAGRIASMQSVSSIVAALGPRPPDIANRLGDLFYGENDDIALAEYTQAADQGDPQGEANLGKMYLLGRAVPEDDQRALTLFHQADDRGNTDGATGLALMYAQARGVPKDCGRARDYFVRAHMRGPGLTTMLARFDCK